MVPRSLGVLAVVEAIALFALLFVVADSSPLGSLGVIAAIVLLCVIALRLVGTETFSWLPERGALLLLALLNAVGVAVGVAVVIGVVLS